MLTITQKHYIRKLYYNKGKSKTDIEKATGHNYRTITKYIEQQDFNEDNNNIKRSNKSEYLRPLIRECLISNKDLKKKHSVSTAESIYRYIENQGIEINVKKRRFRGIVREEKHLLQEDNDVYIDLVHPGGEAQIDFGEIQLKVNGTYIKKHELVLSFPHSNAGFVQITESEQSEALFEAMEKIFHYKGSVPTKIWFDQMSTAAIRKKDASGQVIMTNRMKHFSMHYTFESVFCNPYSGNEKGSVENKVGYYRRNLINPNRNLTTLEAMNQTLLAACDTDHLRKHYQHNETIQVRFNREKSHMLPVNPNPIDMSRVEKRKVDKYGHITFETNAYSVHPSYVKMWIFIRIREKKIDILNGTYELITTHTRSYHSFRTMTHWQDFIEPLKRRPRAIKYSGLYELLPENWQSFLHTLTKEDQNRH